MVYSSNSIICISIITVFSINMLLYTTNKPPLTTFLSIIDFHFITNIVLTNYPGLPFSSIGEDSSHPPITATTMDNE